MNLDFGDHGVLEKAVEVQVLLKTGRCKTNSRVQRVLQDDIAVLRSWVIC